MTDHRTPADAPPVVTPAQAAAFLRAHDAYLITTHANPDGDALGAECALAHALRAEGKRVRVVNVDPVPENLAFLAEGCAFERYDAAAHDAAIRDAGAIVVVDLNDATRTGAMAAAITASPAPKLVVDHHLAPKPFADAYLVRGEASATCEILYELFVEAGMPVSPEAARGLYTGIMTDTGSFRFDATTPAVHRIAAALLERGVDPAAVYQRIYDNYPIGRTRLLGMVLETLTPIAGGRASVMRVTRSMFKATGTGPVDVENVVNLGLAVRGVSLTAFLTELEDAVKISFRSRHGVAVLDLARRFGGGGHAQASGATVRGRGMDEVLSEVVGEMEREMGERR
jgi:phosphoesterase RecJ-like protein